jgi:hypothetical protein
VNAVCRHHIVKPFAGGDGVVRGAREVNPFSDYAKEYCTHPNSPHLPGTPEGVACGGDVKKCEIPKAKR